jgi:serine protease AprX
MKILSRAFVLLMLGFLVSASFLRAEGGKISARLERVLGKFTPSEQAVVWVYFTDKGSHEAHRFSVPPTVVTERSLQRRAKVRTATTLVDYSDLPVDQSYVEQVAPRVIRVRQRSKWFNGVSVMATRTQIHDLEALPIVKQIDLLARFPRNRSEREENGLEESGGIYPASPTGTNSLNYGASYTQLNQIGIPAIHDMGNHGEGVLVGVFDNGFRLLTHQAFDSLNIIATYDFVDHKVSVVPNNPSTSFGAHGVNTLSTIGGYRPGQIIGPAFKAGYILARTENDSSETPVEEDNWTAAIEWADSIGVEVTSTSLGYSTFDPPYASWTWEDMNGNTTVITRAADMAVARGIVVVNSAGNEGYNASRNTLIAPADGDSVFTIGAVDSFGVRSSFSSVGPTTSVPARIKPDVMAMGTAVRVASATNPTSYTRSNGTSFSCPLAAGAAALMVCAWPNATPVQIMDALRFTANQASNPDNSYGWGILNTFAAMQPRVPTLASPGDNATHQPLNLSLAWNAALGAETYTIQLATDSLFTSLVVSDSTVTGTSRPVNSLSNNTRYYWRVRSKNLAGSSTYSQRWSFTTLPRASPPPAPILVQPTNGFTNQPTTLSFVWRSSSSATGYRLQLATDSLFTASVFDDSTIIDTTRSVTGLAGNTTFYWRVKASNVVGSSPFSVSWSLTTTAQVTRHYAVTGGWNLVSVPLGVIDYRKTTLFPTALSTAFAFVPPAGYMPRDTLTNGAGYWLNFAAADSVEESGLIHTNDTIAVSPGWNLIGSISSSVPVGSILESPSGIIQSPYFGYEGGYSVADTLQPAKGYWVKSGAVGNLLLASGTLSTATHPERKAQSSSQRQRRDFVPVDRK